MRSRRGRSSLSVLPGFTPGREDVKRLLAAYTKEKGPAGPEAAFAVYSSEWESTPSQTTIKRTAVDIGTDYIFLVPVETAIHLHAANARLVAGSMITMVHDKRLLPSSHGGFVAGLLAPSRT